MEWKVQLPAGVREPFVVFVNGVRQQPGNDFAVRSGKLVFSRPLANDRVSKKRWAIGWFGVGTYRQDDSVDVAWTAADGRRASPTARHPGPAGRSGACGLGLRRAPGRDDPQRGRIARVAGRAVERVEVDAGRAVGEQVGALQRRVGDAELGRASGSSARASSSRRSPSGIVEPHIAVIRLIWATFVIGMMPGMIGTSIPIARARRTKSK